MFPVLKTSCLIPRFLSLQEKKKKKRINFKKRGYTKEWQDRQAFRYVLSLENNELSVILAITFTDNYLERTTGVRKIEMKEPKIQGYEVRYMLAWI